VNIGKSWHAGCYVSFGDPTGTLRVNGFSLGLIGRVAFFCVWMLLDELWWGFLPLASDGIAVIPHAWKQFK